MSQFMVRQRWLVVGLVVGLLLLLTAACGGREDTVVIQLAEQESSGQSGTATLTVVGDQTEVVLILNPGPSANDPQPVHIHFGACGANLGSVAYALSDVIAGESTTLVAASLVSVRDGNHAINLHTSYPEIRVYTACGNIPTQ